MNGIFGAVLDRRLHRIGEEFQVNKQVEGVQLEATVAAADQTFLVVWTDYGNDHDAPHAVYGQLFDSLGRRLGEVLPLAVYPTDYAIQPSVAALSDAAPAPYVVLYETVHEPELGPGIDLVARFVSGDGALGERISLTKLPGRDDTDPSVVAFPAGFAATWSGWDQSGPDVYLQRFSNSAAPVGPEVRVNSYTEGFQAASDLAISGNGSVVVVWSSYELDDPGASQDGDGVGLYGQAFAPNGDRIGTEFRVSTRTLGNQGSDVNTSDVTFLNDTDFVVVWQESLKGGSASVHARLFQLTTDQRQCGDTIGHDLSIDAGDALGVLRASVGIGTCARCSCDIDGSGGVGVPDAQRVLRLAVALPEETNCPRCSPS